MNLLKAVEWYPLSTHMVISGKAGYLFTRMSHNLLRWILGSCLIEKNHVSSFSSMMWTYFELFEPPIPPLLANSVIEEPQHL